MFPFWGREMPVVCTRVLIVGLRRDFRARRLMKRALLNLLLGLF
jgi:hypothetical protein